MNQASQHKIPSLIIRTESTGQTEHVGEMLGALLADGDMLCLTGTLGAGKTSLTRGLAKGWGTQQHPTSPTFTLVNEYTRPQDDQRFYHMDCYRLSGAGEAQTTGLDDMLAAPGVLVIEWPERIEDILPPDALWIEIEYADEGERIFTFNPRGERAKNLVVKLKAELV